MRWLRKIWHDFYYYFAAKKAVAFALTCQETVKAIDLSQKKSIRMNLHLSLCQACSNYLTSSVWLSEHLRNMKRPSNDLGKLIFKRIAESDKKKL